MEQGQDQDHAVWPLKYRTVIDRRTWLRGAGAAASYLLTRRGTRCCVGFHLQQRGADDKALRNSKTAASTVLWDSLSRTNAKLWSDCILGTDLPGVEWLDESRVNEMSGKLPVIYEINDDGQMSDGIREAQVVGIFAIFGDTEVVFEN